MKPIKVLGNGREVIDLLAREGPLSPAQIAQHTGIPRPSVYRLVDGLSSIDFTTTTNDARVGLSLRWLILADASRAGMTEWHLARAMMRALVDETGQTAFLTIPREGSALCIDWEQGRGIGVLILKPGRTLPYYAGAAGRVLLAYCENDPTDYARAAPFPRLTPSTLTTEDELRADVQKTREQGFVFSDEDVTVGIGAVGVPIIDRDGLTRGCISLAGLADDIRAQKAQLAATLVAAAADFGTAL